MHVQTEEHVDILIVDDRDDGLIALEALLTEYKHYNLVKARSGIEAIALLEDYDFALILLDVQMPHLDGFETAEIIRAQPRFQSIPIIFVTAINKDDRYVYRGYEAGAVDYIFKPFDPIILRSKVAIFVELFLKSKKIQEQSRQLKEREALEHRAFIQSIELENLRRYRNLADAIPHMILRASATGLLDYHNRFWSNYTGMSTTESLGTGWQNAIHPDEIGRLLKEWGAAMNTGERYNAQCRIRRADGVFRWHWVKAEPERDASGVVIAWLGTCTDIQDWKGTEEKLKLAQRNAESANEAKTHFLANMSHEIRTPLNAIMGFTELLLDPNITIEEKMKSVAIVRRNGHQLLKIVDEILDISKVEAGGLVTEMVETRILDLMSEIKTLLLAQAVKKKIDLEFCLPMRVPGILITDSARLRQILLNIIGNAIKFTEKGSVKVSMRFSTSMEGRSFLNFEVQDTGLGLNPESSEKIFKPFSQADSSTTRIYGGTGLGLPLSRRLAQALGGDVALKASAPGKGSTFAIDIEVELPPKGEWVRDTSEVGDTVAVVQKTAVHPSPLAGKRVLLVEDAEDNQFLIRQFLLRTEVHLDVANNGQEGIDKALANDYDIILMDIQMPVLDGYEATVQLRQAGYALPIIALTAHALIEERDRCLRTGCNGHLTKPISRKQLLDCITKFTTSPAPEVYAATAQSGHTRGELNPTP